MSNFVHLHVHTEYSLLDGSCRITELLQKAKELKMEAIAITDHGNLYGAVEFYEKAKEYGIKPIIGCEVYLAKRTRFDRIPKTDDDQYHLILLAQNQEGYQNLLKLVTFSNLEGFYYKPRVDKELLKKYHGGLIALSGCIGGDIACLILKEEEEEAKKLILEYQEIFGKENFYLELQDNLLPDQKIANQGLFKLSQNLKVPLVITNDVHYLNKEDAKFHDILLCVQTQKTLDDPKRLKFGSSEFYLKNQEEIQKLFSDLPAALSNSIEIAQKCNFNFEFNKIYLPNFPIPSGDNLDSFLERLCYENLKKRFREINFEIEERLKYELSIIKNKGFSTYFLIVSDFIQFAKKNNIPVGPGRGSAAGSLVAYLLGITEINPLKYGLIFERFLNPERPSLPDIDTDFCVIRRDEVIQYVKEKYGQDCVSQIVTFGRMKARAAVRDVGRVLKLPLSFVDKVAKLIPPTHTIDTALQTPELQTLIKEDSRVKELLESARPLEGLARNASIHAAGIVITNEPLMNYVPLQKMKGNEIVAQYEMHSLEKIGLLKMDFLGLRNLTVIQQAINLIEKNKNIKLNLFEIPLDDSKTFKLLQEARTLGIFQLESEGMRRYLLQLKAECFEDLIALLALYRPGALSAAGAVDDFIAIKQGRKKPVYLHPNLKPILEETYGVIVYQEQVIKIASALAGYTLAKADELRKAMGKKDPALMKKNRKTFIEGCLNQKIDKKIATKIFDLIEFFAGYGFNKSHATAYALIAYQTAYLKANYPEEYMAALLASIMDDIDKVNQFIKESNQLGLKILPPSVNESEMSFSVSSEGIRWGLAAIKNVGKLAIQSILESRAERGNFISLLDFSSRVDSRLVNKRVIESLIKSGAFDSLNKNRADLINHLDKTLEQAERSQKKESDGQISLFDLNEKINLEIIENNGGKIEEFDIKKLLSFEKEFLGVYLSSHPLINYIPALEKIISHKIEELAKISNKNSNVIIGGIINSNKKILTKNNQNMAFLQIEDLTGWAEVIILPKVYERFKDLIKEDSIIGIKGKVELNEDNEEENQVKRIKILADEIFSMEDIFTGNNNINNSKEENKKENLLGFHIKIERFHTSLLDKLKNILSNFHGNCAVYLHLEGPQRRNILTIDSHYWVSENGNLIKMVEELLGEKTIWKEG